MNDWPKAWGAAVGQGVIKAQPSDFQVIEELGFTPSGSGEHLWLSIEKTGWNTEDVAMWLAKEAGIHRLAVGYSGLKDKQAVTCQWFSLWLPGKPDPTLAWPAGLRCLAMMRHGRKLNRGTHRSNAFQLRVTQCTAEAERVAQRLELITRSGVPNYVGKQRMGRFDSNLSHAMGWLGGTGEAPRKRPLKGLWLSAMRSHLFNLVLAERVSRGVWDHLLAGDVLQPDGSRGLFHAADDAQAEARVSTGEVHPTAPLPGSGGMLPTAECAQMEAAVLAPFAAQVDGLVREGLEAARRATRLVVRDVAWQQERDALVLSFRLPAGAFATTVLAELIEEKKVMEGEMAS